MPRRAILQHGAEVASTKAMSMPPPCPVPFNLAAYVLAKAALLPEKPALIILGDDGPHYSYARLEAAVRGCGTLLLRQGLARGDRVLLRLGNSPAFPIAYLAAIAAGLVPVPSSAALTVPEITAMARVVAPALIVADENIALPDFACPVLRAAQVLAAEALAPCAYQMGDPDDLAYIVFSSGSSGQPLPVAHAHRAVWARRMMHGDWQSLGADDRLLHAGALNWTYTLGVGLLDPWVQGATALIPGHGLVTGDLARLLARFEASIFAAAPGVYRQMLRSDIPPLPALRHGLSAGEALPEVTAAAWRDATGTEIYQALGMSECSTFISGAPGRPAPAGAIGFAQTGRRIAVLDHNGRPVAPGQPGTLAIHRDNPGLMLGYFDQPALTAGRYAGAWFLTGDQVSQDGDGAIRYLGRDDDMMNPGGYRVSPLEVEAAIATAPGVTDCAVVEVEVGPSNRIIACLYTAAGPISEAVLADHAALHLARYKQPRGFIRLDALPRNANNKLNRAALRQAAARILRPQEGL